MVMKEVEIGPFKVGQGHRPIVIAEAGINHNGDVEVALQMVRKAAEIGADVIKFQTHIAEAEMLSDRGSSSKAGSHVTRSLFDIMTECHLTFEEHLLLKKEAEKVGILFLSTPFSIQAFELLEKVGVPAFKIGSGEVTNLPFLDYISKRKKPMILSTGTGNMDEIAAAVRVIQGNGAPLVLMQCTSNYPTAWENVNLGVIPLMREKFGVPVGLSDHCQGNYAAYGAVPLGACILEKHFTLSRNLPGVDQSSSGEPHEIKELVDGVRAIHLAMGARKELNQEAMMVRRGFSESVVTIAPVKAGEILKEHVNVWVKRPGTGIPSYDLPKVVGKRAKRDVPPETLLRFEDFGD